MRAGAYARLSATVQPPKAQPPNLRPAPSIARTHASSASELSSTGSVRPLTPPCSIQTSYPASASR